MQNMKSWYPDTQQQEFTTKRPVASYSVSDVVLYKKKRNLNKIAKRLN